MILRFDKYKDLFWYDKDCVGYGWIFNKKTRRYLYFSEFAGTWRHDPPFYLENDSDMEYYIKDAKPIPKYIKIPVDFE